MSNRPPVRQTPEEREYQLKAEELAARRSELAQRELELTTLHAELEAFEARYLRTVGARYAELDEVQAMLAEVQVALTPKETETQRQAEQARRHAQQTADVIRAAGEETDRRSFSDELKNLYREIAKAVHPDLATGEEERTFRQQLMASANQAYAEGDETQLREIIRAWDSSPDSVKGAGPGVELVRMIRKLDQVKSRLRAIENEQRRLQKSDLYVMKTHVDTAEARGIDLLGNMALRVELKIADARARLAVLSPGIAT